MRIFINPGHCPGIDSGATNGVYQEALIARDVGERVKKYLEDAGHEVIYLQSNNLCGEDDNWPDICLTANRSGAAIFVSIHCNGFPNSRPKGTECLVYSHWSQADKLAHHIQKMIVDTLGTVDRGVKENANLAVLKHTYMPAVLVEMAFITNDDDLQLLLDRQDDFARAIVAGIVEYLEG